MGKCNPSAEMQTVYSAAPADWAIDKHKIRFKFLKSDSRLVLCVDFYEEESIGKGTLHCRFSMKEQETIRFYISGKRRLTRHVVYKF